jgi:hypothetical protein
MPPVLQDIVIKLVSTSGLGYVGVLLLRLYRIHPALPFVSIILLSLIIYFANLYGNQNKFLKMREIVPLVDSPTNMTTNVHMSLNQIQPMCTGITNTEAVSESRKVKTRRASLLAGISVVEELRQQQHTVEHIERTLSSALDPNENDDSNDSKGNEGHQSDNGDRMMQCGNATNDCNQLVCNRYDDIVDNNWDDSGHDVRHGNNEIDNLHQRMDNNGEEKRFEHNDVEKKSSKNLSGEVDYSSNEKDAELGAEYFDDFMNEFMSLMKEDTIDFS